MSIIAGIATTVIIMDGIAGMIGTETETGIEIAAEDVRIAVV
jgi:hypothetical protein